jgi:hypothetical protein
MADGRIHNGGARPGAGRKPKPIEDAQQSVLLELFNETEERAVVLNMLSIAKRKGPLNATSAISAATWLWDRKYGKPKDLQEHSGGLTIRIVDETDGRND